MKNMNLTRSKKVAMIVGVAAVVMLLADPAFAGGGGSFNASGKSIGSVATNITSSIKGIGPLITAICYVGALVFGLIGAMKWKAYGEQPDRTPLKIPITYWGIAVLLAGFPEFMGTGITTLWGSGASLVSEP